jgi:hypothetical protein
MHPICDLVRTFVKDLAKDLTKDLVQTHSQTVLKASSRALRPHS